jgi:hypothetical protein
MERPALPELFAEKRKGWPRRDEASLMQPISSPSKLDKRRERNRLRRLRYLARKGRFRVISGVAGFSLVTIGTNPPRPIAGLIDVDLEDIAVALWLRQREANASARRP